MPRPGSRHLRGYGNQHTRERARWAPIVATGTITCWRCGHPILAGQPWDLGHDDHDRTTYCGPEHQHCNRAAGGRKNRGRRRSKRVETTEPITSRQWW